MGVRSGAPAPVHALVRRRAQRATKLCGTSYHRATDRPRPNGPISSMSQWSLSPYANVHGDGTGVTFQVPFVDAKEYEALVRRDELGLSADEDEVVVVIADDGDERAKRLVRHQRVQI